MTKQSKVVDLMEALQQSVQQAKEARKRQAPRRRTGGAMNIDTATHEIGVWFWTERSRSGIVTFQVREKRYTTTPIVLELGLRAYELLREENRYNG